jgi:hypothetical protein
MQNYQETTINYLKKLPKGPMMGEMALKSLATPAKYLV